MKGLAITGFILGIVGTLCGITAIVLGSIGMGGRDEF